MKFLLSMLCCVSFTGSIYAGHIITYSKSNKGLFGYDKVNSTNTGTDQSGNLYWAVECSDPGLIRCKRTLNGMDNDLIIYADALLMRINDEVDARVEDGDSEGTLFHKILRTHQGNTTWVSFTTSWETVNRELLVTIIIDEVPNSL